MELLVALSRNGRVTVVGDPDQVMKYYTRVCDMLTTYYGYLHNVSNGCIAMFLSVVGNE